MLLLSNTTDTRIGVKFNVTNMDVTGFTASIKINGKAYALSPVADGATALVTIPLADAQAISTTYFGAQITVLDKDGKAYQVSGWPGMMVSYSLSDLVVDNLLSLPIAPPFPVPDDDGGGGGGDVKFDQVPTKDSKNAVYSGGLYDEFKGVKEALDETVKTVNGTEPDENGNVQITTVQLAKNLVSTDLIVDGPNLFSRRTSGGSSDVETGPAFLRKVLGHCTESVHEMLGYVSVQSGSSVVPTVSINADTFAAGTGVAAGANIFTYSTTAAAWTFNGASVNLLTDYGITCTPGSYSYKDNDKIIVDYTPESLTYELNAVDETATAAVDQATFAMKVSGQTANYIFIASSDGAGGIQWNLNGEAVTLSQYGITLTGTFAEDDTLTVRYAAKFATIRYDEADVSAAVDAAVFRVAVADTQEPGKTVNYVFTYNGSAWTLGGTTVNLSYYGITVQGTFANGGKIEFPFTLERTVAVAAPISFKAVGFNSFDKATMLEGTTAVVPVAYNDSNTFRGYVIYAATGAVSAVSQVDADGTETPITASDDPDLIEAVTNGETAAGHENQVYVITSSAYALKIVLSSAASADELCVHPCWSGQSAWQDAGDNDYEPYTESIVPIPTADADGTALPTATYGIPGIKGVWDEIDFTNRTYTQRIGRTSQPVTAYAAANPTKVEWTDYIGDSTQTYYVLDTPVVYDLASSVSPNYEVNDWSIEEFVYAEGAERTPAYATTNYGQNLVRKLVRDVVTKGELTPEAIRALARYEQVSVASDDVPSAITLSADSANVYDLSQASSVAITLPTVPEAGSGKAADVVVRLDTGATLPSISFLPQSDVMCPMDGDDSWGTLTANAMNFFSFTSMGSYDGHRVWMVGHYATEYPAAPTP